MGKYINTKFDKFASFIMQLVGTSGAFIIVFLIVTTWAIVGIFLKFSIVWQSIIDVVTSIITFLMVFIIQHSQNKDTLAIQLKLNEIIASIEGASNRLIDVEGMTDEDLKVIQKFYLKVKDTPKSEGEIKSSKSIEDVIKKDEEEDDKLNNNP